MDEYVLLLQFKNNIHTKFGIEFQSFFENIMQKAFRDYQKIRPYGNKGDGGNDGYVNSLGIYYQVYAPATPSVNERKAAEKLCKDFQKLKAKWNEISKIKEYYFVYNDKYDGSTIDLESAISNLKKDNPEIKFALFLALDLEHVFRRLSEVDLLDLGFNIDHRQVVSNVYSYLDIVKKELEKENAFYAQKILMNEKYIIGELGDENLSIEFELLEAKCLQKTEEIEKAIKKYEGISKKYPNDPRALINLAVLYLNQKQDGKYRELIDKAQKIDPTYWSLLLEQFLRKVITCENEEIINMDVETFPDDPLLKSNYYRILSIQYQIFSDYDNADKFIMKAINYYPDKFVNYLIKLSFSANRMLLITNSEQKQELIQSIKKEIEEVENQFCEDADIGLRNKANLNIYKLQVLFEQANIPEFEKLSNESLSLLLGCFFDIQIEQLLIRLLANALLPIDKLSDLTIYLQKSGMEISDDLSNELISQFLHKGLLFTDGKNFFERLHSQKYLDLINYLQNEDDLRLVELLKGDLRLTIIMANSLIDFPETQKKIIDTLPNEGHYQKEMLLLLHYYKKKDYDEASKILRMIDYPKLNYHECRQILSVVHSLEFWEYEIIVLNKLLEEEKNKSVQFSLKIQLFNAYFALGMFAEIIRFGESLLEEDLKKNILSMDNKEALLVNTIEACFERGKIEPLALTKAKEILEKYRLDNHSYDFSIGIAAEVYIKNGEEGLALKCIIEGVRKKKNLSSQEYARLNFLLSIRIGDRLHLNLNSEEMVQEDTFVKLVNMDGWYYIGSGNELDAVPIRKDSNKYSNFIDKKLGDLVEFTNRYGLERSVSELEFIYPIEKYILWQSLRNFQKLTIYGDLEGVQLINVAENENGLDLQHLLHFFEDTYQKTAPFFEIYRNGIYPLAMLAISDGGLIPAIAHIQGENKGYINFCSGEINDYDQQKRIAKKVIDDQLKFYLDGTSALFMSEVGLLNKIFHYLPNLMVPQSVINFLLATMDRFNSAQEESGYLHYAQGKIGVSIIEKTKRNLILSNFQNSIRLLESKPQNISIISTAYKLNYPSEKKVPAELSDACQLAQKEESLVLTEDYLYIKWNELETKKKPISYFSSLALVGMLYDEGKLKFDDYLQYFCYLSSYRFRFLTITVPDIEKAVFGEGKVKRVIPENIRLLNFPLTLSEDYGVPFSKAFTVVAIFLTKVILDSTITADVSEKIFVEIIESFPAKIHQRDLGQLLLRVCNKVIEENGLKQIGRTKDKHIHDKYDRLLQLTEIYNYAKIVLKPD